MSRDDGFLDRWSRRKRAATDQADPSRPPVAGAARDAGDSTPPGHLSEAISEEELLEKLGLPDPDTLKEGDDFQAFLKAGVPDFLKKRALRRLWLSNPALANLDGLLEYGEDFTDAANVPEVVMTAYKVGRGFLKEVLEEPAEAPQKTDGINQETAAAAAADTGPDSDPEPAPGDDLKEDREPFETDAEIAPRPRRMAFRHD